MNNRKAYIRPAFRVLHMVGEGYLCVGTLEKQEKYGPQNETEGGHNSSSFGEDYGDLFGDGTNSAKALGAPFEDEAD
ncbi:MAG: hypothetical protein MR450_01855 [Prevotella sp.]|nr:hypothetical protein [Prevotella sp.]MDY4038975.1 hypothetical protein [Prevotella sp.]